MTIGAEWPQPVEVRERIQPKEFDPFAEVLRSASGGVRGVPEAGQNPATTAQAGQIPVIAEPAEEEGGDALALLKQALIAKGCDPGVVQMQVEPGICTYPGGAYNNDQIRVTFGDGNSERYSLNLMSQAPHVTAMEIMAKLGIG